jgi:hypothetical protein
LLIWKYELDCQSNEDLWKQQLFRHAVEAVKGEEGVTEEARLH